MLRLGGSRLFLPSTPFFFRGLASLIQIAQGRAGRWAVLLGREGRPERLRHGSGHAKLVMRGEFDWRTAACRFEGSSQGAVSPEGGGRSPAGPATALSGQPPTRRAPGPRSAPGSGWPGRTAWCRSRCARRWRPGLRLIAGRRAPVPRCPARRRPARCDTARRGASPPRPRGEDLPSQPHGVRGSGSCGPAAA